MLKKNLIIASAALCLLAGAAETASADYPRAANRGYQVNDQYAYARVVDIKPLIRTVRVEVPVRECYEQPVTYETRRRGNAGRTIAGGIIGGLIGNQFGDGRGRDAMTVLGTVIGASAANADQPRGQSETRLERYCETRYEYEERDRVEGYRVTYRYKGETYTTRTSTDPGDRIRVRVRVQPLVD
ncbi:MAG: glycine zipper 2TM domain-containing protein [Pseudomonadota bacterium]